MQNLITPEQLSRIEPSLKRDDAIKYADAINKVCPLYGINSITILEDFLANVLHEAPGFKSVVESLNYSVNGLISTFGTSRISIPQAKKYGRIDGVQKADQKAIANIVYGGEWGKRNLGNVLVNDGWELRGSGMIQITGRYLFTKLTKYLNKICCKAYSMQDIVGMLRDPKEIEIGLHAACWLFAVEKSLIDESVNNKVLAIRRAINGGYNGLEKVIALTNKINKVLSGK